MTPNQTVLGLLAMAALCAAPAVRAQEEQPQSTQQQDPKPAVDQAEIQGLIEELGAEKNADRKAAEAALRELGESAREALQSAVENHDDPEVRWRARRVLRSLEGEKSKLEPRSDADERGTPGRSPIGQDGDLHDRVRQMIEEMERAFGQDMGGLRGIEDLQREMEEMREQMDRLHSGFRGMLPDLGIPMSGLSQGTQIQIGPDGVKVEIQEKGEDGQVETKTYEAESVEAFREKHPEIAKRFFGPGGGMFFGGPGAFRMDLPDIGHPDVRQWTDRERGLLRRDPFRGEPVEVIEAPQPAAPPPEGERLGVYLGDLAPAVREFLEIESGVGVLVASVEAGSLAEALGVQPKDVIVKIGDQSIGDPSDVRRALRDIAKGEQVVVQVNRRGEQVELKAEKRHDAPSAGSGDKLRERESPQESGQRKR